MIGVFDSGSGGLSVLRAFLDRLPEQSFLYLGDHANGPYGERSEEDVYVSTVAGVDALFQRGCHLVVIACNTAAAVALRRLQQSWLPVAYPHRRALGVFVPIVEAVTGVDWAIEGRRTEVLDEDSIVGVFATQRTVSSGAFSAEIKHRSPHLSVIEQACPGLAESIEADLAPDRIQALVTQCAAQLLSRIDRIERARFVLGCTHYPLVHDAFVRALPGDAVILEQPKIAAESLAQYLLRHPEFSRPAAGVQTPDFLTTGDSQEANAHARLFFGHDIAFASVLERKKGVPSD